MNDGFVDAAGAARLGMAAHMRAVTAFREAETDLAAVEAERIHADARDLAAAVPAFGPALGAHNAGQPVVPLTADGTAALPAASPLGTCPDCSPSGPSTRPRRPDCQPAPSTTWSQPRSTRPDGTG
jgi:hypothetical protein